MIELKEQQDVYFSRFAELEKRAAGEPAWLRQIRRAALDRFGELGFPTTHDEEWRFTNVAPIANMRFQPARGECSSLLAERVKRLPFVDPGCSRLVFLNGRYCPELSAAERIPQGVQACSLAGALAAGNPALEQHLARYAGYQDHAFVALNTAFIEDGAFLEIPRGLVIEEPIQLVFITTGNGRPTISHPRNLVLLGRESQVTLIESHMALNGGVYFTNAVTELVAGENAVAHYCKVQNESEQAYHLGTLQVQLARDSHVTTSAIALGAALTRQDLAVVLDGEGAEAQLYGLYVMGGGQHVDNYTTLDHARAHTSSREFYKGVLDGKSSAAFHGRIIVRKGAQKTDAKQSNRNLLLSDEATINTKPQLEIYADDVKCTHGATIGQIDPEAVFYLRSRGIGNEEARRMLTYAFANEIISQLKYEPLRARLTEALTARLTNAPRAEEAS